MGPREPRPCRPLVDSRGHREPPRSGLRSWTSALDLQSLLHPAGSLRILHPDVKLLGLVRPDSGTRGPPSCAINEVLYVFQREDTTPLSGRLVLLQPPWCSHPVGLLPCGNANPTGHAGRSCMLEEYLSPASRGSSSPLRLLCK